MGADSPQFFSFDEIIGQSRVIRETLNLARRVAESDLSCVLLQGESGTGKDCLAKAIHYASRRALAPFVAINCAALPANLVESELFGYEKGAFTDAKVRKEGLLELADGGTILLDEISELDINLQAKLLRVLEDGTLRRVGGLKNVGFTARVIAASNRDLKAETDCGRFRLDLYYRLAVIQIDIPPLREREDDVLLLANHFLSTFRNRNGRQTLPWLSSQVVRAFKLYSWPGNVRELRNVVERTTVLEDDDEISAKSLPPHLVTNPEVRISRPERVNPDFVFNLPSSGISLEALETSLIKQALTQSNGNQTRAAKLLGLTRDQFRYRWKKIKKASKPHLVAVGGLHG